MSLFVIIYMWQNIEVVQIKMKNRSLTRTVDSLVKDRDRLLYEIERYRRMDTVEDFARKNGFKTMLPEDFNVLVINEANAQQ